MNRYLVAAAIAVPLVVSFASSAKAPAPVIAEPPEVDLEAYEASVKIREGLHILEQYETFVLYAHDGMLIVETEPEPADSMRLDALGWESGPGMQEWYFHLPVQEE